MYETASVYGESDIGSKTTMYTKQTITKGGEWQNVTYAGGNQSHIVPPAPSAVGTSALDSGSGSDFDSASDSDSDTNAPKSKVKGSAMSSSSYQKSEKESVDSLKKNAWAKPVKVAKGKETKWGQEQERMEGELQGRMEWAAYSRRIRDYREGIGKPFPQKEEEKESSSEEENDSDEESESDDEPPW